MSINQQCYTPTYPEYENTLWFYRDSYDIHGKPLQDKPVNNIKKLKPKAKKNRQRKSKQETKRKEVSVTRNEQAYAIKSDIKIFCDGSWDPQSRKAGSGVVIYSGNAPVEALYGDFLPNGTNNVAELNALYKALVLAQKEIMGGKSVTIFSDSKYSINSVTDWSYRWKRKGWSKSGGPIKNLDIIQKAHFLYHDIRDDVEVRHVKSHIGVSGNEIADELAKYAIKTKAIDYEVHENL